MYRSLLKIKNGVILVEANDNAITGVHFYKCMPDVFVEENELTKKCKEYLNEYFEGKRKNFNIPIELHGTDFQKNVWKALMNVPYGETKSYKEIAENVGSPKAVRAVGGACSKNPILIIVPCHRIVGSSGKLTGFACGLDMKQQLIELENYHAGLFFSIDKTN